MSNSSNQVLTDDAHKSSNFWESDKLLQTYLEAHLSDDALKYMKRKLDTLGRQAAGRMNKLSRQADRNQPNLKQRNKIGETVNEVEFHPAYWELMDIAARSEMLAVKYQPELHEQFEGQRHKMGFAAGQLFSMTELSQYCPLCMTDGAAYLIEQFANKEIQERLLTKLSAKEADDLFTGAMFLTEKAGGSDVGAALCTAGKVSGKQYKLNGEKWFCSNVNADVMMVLARTGKMEDGTKGLSLFLVEKKRQEKRDSIDIIRLKDKLGVRSMATGEVQLNDTKGLILGEEGEGFKLMAEMINVSRTYNAVASLAAMRRAVIEAWQYLSYRTTFGKQATEHALVRQKFWELGSQYFADFLLTWRTIRAFDNTEAGDQSEKQLLRMLVPMAKWQLAESGVYVVRECMELMGGNGYIEDFVMPRLLRDVNVLPIWEGSGNIIVLDMLRAAQKGDGLQPIFDKIEKAAAQAENIGDEIKQRIDQVKSVFAELQSQDDRDIIETTAKPLFIELIQLYQMTLVTAERNNFPEKNTQLTLEYLSGKGRSNLELKEPPSPEAINTLIGWEY